LAKLNRFCSKIAKINWAKENSQKINILAHREYLKSAKIYLLLYFEPLWAKNIQNLNKNLVENS
jgi:hypothetical protein